ncbi:MAG: adenosine deaminase [Clostridia bacterium]|nr:adenosine deaminase [Clostridia bacterium]
MIDLHLHLDGSLSAETIIKLAQKQGVALPTYDKKELEKKYLSVPKECESLNDYLKCFELPLSVLQTKGAITQAVYALQENLKKQGLIYAEIRFAPQLHTQNGLTQQEVIEAAIKGLNKSSLKSNLILCCMRGDNNHEENIETVNLAEKYLNKGVCAVDLAGAEALFKTHTFNKEFELARQKNIPFTIHCGEADGPESIKAALDFGAKRLGHGIHAIEDKELMERIKRENIYLEMCPTSNFQTKTVETKEDYPFKKFIKAGLNVTINTDNTTVSNTTIDGEYKFLEKHFGLTENDKYKLMNNSINAAFISEKEKRELRNLLNQKLEEQTQTF